MAPAQFGGPTDPRLPARERVVTLAAEGAEVAVGFSTLSRVSLATIALGSIEVLVLWAPGTVSPLAEHQILESRDVGAAAASLPEVDGQALTFVLKERGRFEDEQTGSLWDVTGLALEGPLKGSRLPFSRTHPSFGFPRAATPAPPSGCRLP